MRGTRHCGSTDPRSAPGALALWFVLGAVLLIAGSAYLLPVRAQAAGPAETIAVTLSPSSIVADGVSTATATATVRVGGAPLPGQTVAFSSSDSGIRFGPTVDKLNGTYSATLTSSTVAGTDTVTATSRWGGQTASGGATLTQTSGPAKSMTLSLEPGSLIADGSSFATATATVTDAHGNPVRTDAVVFSASDPRSEVMQSANNGNGTYSALIRSSTTPGQVAIEATDTTANLSVRSELRQTAGASMLSLVTMQWTFHYTRAYTTVLSLMVEGAPAATSVLVDCRGRGCPFAERLNGSATTRGCVHGGKRGCPPDGAINLTRDFQSRRLRAGTRITVAITRPGSMGKRYVFDVRAARPPRVHVNCLGAGGAPPIAPC
ncbi:MAG TPA: Ig-like domain-containing protein [Solirubrobacteraceae bacterium]|nr:Ig-like domain-containing protein [Solirubrobacteraceae bacterium]